LRVLIADDSSTILRLLEASLETWGYEVMTATDGAETLSILSSVDAPEIAILDWVMPVFSGPELCRRVRARRSGRYTYLILLSARDQQDDVVEGLRAGADDYLTKPFDLYELEMRVRAGRRIVELQTELLRTQDALREQAMTDALTGCWNRAAILGLLDREMARAGRERKSFSVLMVDLDHFKQINDQHGHAVGDAALRESVLRMKMCMRPYDALGRYGGEEFVVVLPGCDEACAISHAERLVASVAGESIVAKDKELNLTISVGATCVQPDVYVTPEQLLDMADDALYEAKRQGRNRVVYLETGAGASALD